MICWVLAFLGFGTMAACMDDAPYSEQMADRLHPGMTLEAPLVEALNWLEAQGFRTFAPFAEKPNYGYLPLYPKGEVHVPGSTFVAFEWSKMGYTSYWDEPNPTHDARIFELVSTSGDGGRAGLWLDEDGKQWYVHIGHDVAGVITDDPLVFLQFLAMGYIEPGALEVTNITPIEQSYGNWGITTDAEFQALRKEYAKSGSDLIPESPRPPVQFQEFLTERFGLTYPATARDLGIMDFPYYGDPDTKDPFNRWLAVIEPPPDPEEERKSARMVELIQSDPELQDLMTNGTNDPDIGEKMLKRMEELQAIVDNEQ